MKQPITILGDNEPTGTYILRIAVAGDLRIQFGRFRQGTLIRVPQGDVIYVGSAMARSGSMTLARRLLRHATRRPPKPSHRLRPVLLDAVHTAAMASKETQPPAGKKLFWNVDYLMDEEDVQLRQVIILRSPVRLEDEVAALLLADPVCRPIASGLGAHDCPGSTHLLQVRAHGSWWDSLPKRINKLLSEA
jgi:Uri superfamily endonuclease